MGPLTISQAFQLQRADMSLRYNCAYQAGLSVSKEQAFALQLWQEIDAV